MQNQKKVTGIEDLVIFPRLGEIYDMIVHNKQGVCAVVAETGSGKSLGMPWKLAKEGLRVAVSVPTVTAALSLCKRQRELCRMSGLTVDVGYAAEGRKFYRPKSKIIYGTSGHWRRKLLHLHNKDGWAPLKFCDVFILDEVHTGSLDNDAILSLLEDAALFMAGKERPMLTRVLSSATFNEEQYPGVPVMKLEVPSFPVQVTYHNQSFELEEEKYLYRELAREVSRMHKEDPDCSFGHFLVFAPGMHEVEDIILELEGMKLENAMILPAYARLQSDELAKIYDPAPQGVRKIIIGTNVAETSITIPGVGGVFDCLIEKRAGTSSSGGQSLITSRVSKDSATQRKGRTGRDRPGFCKRMCTENDFERTYERSRPPEITRVPLHSIILESLTAYFDPEKLLAKRADIWSIRRSISLLTQLGAIERDATQELPVVKEIGRFAVMLPLSVRNGILLYRWKEEGHAIWPGIVLIALTECFGPSYFWWPRSKDLSVLDAHKDKFFSRYQSQNELAAFAKMWNFMMARVRGLYAHAGLILDHCNAFSLNHKKVREALMTVRQCVDILSGLSFGPFTPSKIPFAKFDADITVENATHLFTMAYQDREMIRVGHPMRPHYSAICEPTSYYILDTRRTICAPNYPRLLSLGDITLRTPRGEMSVIAVALPLIPLGRARRDDLDDNYSDDSDSG